MNSAPELPQETGTCQICLVSCRRSSHEGGTCLGGDASAASRQRAAMQARQQQWSLRGGGLSPETDLEDLDESTALEIALAESLDQAQNEAARVEKAHASMAEYCRISSVEPSGWCFFDCVVNQVGKDGVEAGLSRLGVADLALEELL